MPAQNSIPSKKTNTEIEESLFQIFRSWGSSGAAEVRYRNAEGSPPGEGNHN